MQRRSFLKLSAAAVAGLTSVSETVPVAASAKPRIQRYVPLGNTGLEVSDISFGCSRLSDSKLVRYAYERGVTYFDTAESYRGGASETAVGLALSDVREKVVIASKTKAGEGATRHQMMSALEESLKRLRTDYVDIYYNHAVNDPARMQNPEWAEFTETAKKQGKIRFRGMSGHGSRLIESLDYSLDHDLVDVVLVAFNFAQDPDFEEKLRYLFHYIALQPDLIRVLDKARNKGVGVAAMKILMGARLHDMRPHELEGGTFSQAALKWALASNHIDVALISMTDHAKIDEYIDASGELIITENDFSLLARYVAAQATRYCQHGCGICMTACPYEVPIPELLRVRMYDVDYRDPELALAGYSNLQHQSTRCMNCVEQSCLGSCPNNLPIPVYTRDAVNRFGQA